MTVLVSNHGWRCRCKGSEGRFACCVPPSPDVMSEHYMNYRRSDKFETLTFREYLREVGFIDPSVGVIGMDDGAQFVRTPGGPELLAIPSQPVIGEVRVKVLLVDFPDREGMLPPEHYRDLLFSQDVHPTGSMRDYYREASHGKVDVTGTVDGWIRMPQPYAYYVNKESGLKAASYPRNAPRLAEDAVKAALAKGVTFDVGLDKFGHGTVAALFIVHAGRGAEVMQVPTLRDREIWSHKWNLREPVEVGPALAVTTYLMVPYDCRVGVCAHELGHLAFQWQDFYDPNFGEDGSEWCGSGRWDLMASGSYNGGGARPAHPAPLHKMQHGWVKTTRVTDSASLRIEPYTATAGHVYQIVSARYDRTQYLLLENRKQKGFDFDLPGEGLLVWKVDEKEEMFAPGAPGLSLVQADGQNDLNNPKNLEQGDAGDPFPGSEKVDSVKDTGETSTSFTDKTGTQAKSGITLRNIHFDADGIVTLDVRFTKAAAKKKPPAPAPPRVASAGPPREAVVRAAAERRQAKGARGTAKRRVREPA